ncbi:MAG TPA: C45 family peptidase [Polyangiaceae bacterium]
MKLWARHKKKWLALVLTTASVAALHAGIRWRAHVTPPSVQVTEQALVQAADGGRSFGSARLTRRGAIWEARLSGTPAEIGFSHAHLMQQQMIQNERVLLDHFERVVPSVVLRAALLDLALLRYGNVSRGMSPARLEELAAMARGFSPDPFAGFFATFQRFVYLNALYDIALSFEHSPLIGCTSFVLPAADASAGAGALLARNFDFEVDPIFDRDKAVFLVRETGKIPFASVAWPGLVGVMSGMNQAGVAVVVHGARAAEPSADGEPVVHALRRVLSEADSTERALSVLAERGVMVSHLVILVDASGDGAVVERAPGHPDHVRRLEGRASVTNHFEGPLEDDAKNLRVRQETSTLARRARADELLAALPASVTVADAVQLLRDRAGARGQPLALGDRNAIDALIATHGVVMDTGKRQLWVSEGPHLLGRFVLFDMNTLWSAAPPKPEEIVAIPADPALQSAEVRRHLERDRPR